MARTPRERLAGPGDPWPSRLARAALHPRGPALESRSVGNALLVHPRGFVDSRALTFTQRLAADPQNTLVVLDLPSRPEDVVWETVARALDRQGRSFRLVPGRGTREDVNRAAQWLADRLERSVLAPDGAVLPAAGGALFVPAHHGTGWLRYRPNKPSMPDSRRFPKPQWEYSVPDRPLSLGPGGLAEPLPGGVWLRGSWEEADTAVHRQRLVDLLAAHPDLLGIALGSPGTSALPMEEIAAFWNSLPPSARPLVRFIPYGPVAVPDGAPLGQALADLLGAHVSVYAGLPVAGDGGTPEVSTLLRDGTRGWRPYTDAFGFVPRAQTGGHALAPVALDARVPVGAIPAVAPGVFQYAPDVLLEVVQSGLWVRPPVEPHDSHVVRGAPAHAPYPAILYDETDPMAADRMRSISYELLRGLDPSFSRHSRIMPSSEAGRLPDGATASLANGAPLDATRRGPVTAPGTADGWVGQDPAAGRLALPPAAGDSGTWTDQPIPPRPEPGTGPEYGAPRQQPPAVPLDSQPQFQGPPHQPSLPPTATPVAGPELPAAPPAATARAAAEQRPVPPAPAPVQPPVPPAPAQSAVPPAPVPVQPAVPVTPPGAAQPPAPAAPPSFDAAPPAPAARVEPPTAAPPGAPRIRLESSPTPGPGWPAPRPAGGTQPGPPPAAEPAVPPAPVPAPETPPGPEVPAAPTPAGAPGLGGAVRAQPAPGPAADVTLPAKGVERERDWLLRSLGERYDTAAAFVSRVLSESPGLHGGPRSSAGDALADLAAVRLYLSGATAAIDSAVRSAAPGPHVPLARCAASGLRRLPSHRGATMLRATLSAEERAWYREGAVVAEHSFLAALTTVRRGLRGDTDILVWSLTARRTALVAAEIPDRVLFAPGTRFKVLRVLDGDRPAILLRELSAAEVDENGQVSGKRVPLDEIAAAGLEQVHAFWKKAEEDPDGKAGEPLPEEYAESFRSAPGLLQTRPDISGGPRQSAARAGTLPQKGA
ncbi:hypothetical protein ACFZAR_40725 [Streptomyces sp. NPDC008222]|uniref:hypothetical protein n=1 Tax=Streptomyces sp. NPDC008222 TaxID=3364820 RepID=UPI0036E3C34A